VTTEIVTVNALFLFLLLHLNRFLVNFLEVFEKIDFLFRHTFSYDEQSYLFLRNLQFVNFAGFRDDHIDS
jgi:hypothetical protein